MRLGLWSISLLGAPFVASTPCFAAAQDEAKKVEMKAKSALDFTVKDIDGKDVALARYKGDVLLIVNVASK